MKQITLNIPYEEDKIDAIRQFTAEGKPALESEIIALIDRLYQKNVPAPVREFIAARADAPPPNGSNRRKNRPESTSGTAQTSVYSDANENLLS